MASVKVEKRPFAEEALKQKSRSVFHVWWKHVRGRGRYKFTGVVGVAISSDGIRMEALRGWWPHIKVVLATLDAVAPDWPEKARQSIEHEKHGPFNVDVQRRQNGWEEYVVRELPNQWMLDMPVVGRLQLDQIGLLAKPWELKYASLPSLLQEVITSRHMEDVEGEVIELKVFVPSDVPAEPETWKVPTPEEVADKVRQKVKYTSSVMVAS